MLPVAGDLYGAAAIVVTVGILVLLALCGLFAGRRYSSFSNSDTKDRYAA
jgi:hypothetical protein